MWRLCCCLCCWPDLHAAAIKGLRHPACRVRFPNETTHHPSTGGSHSFTVTSAAPAPPALSSRTYSIPPTPLRPADAWYDRAVPAEVPAVYTSSGHTLVEVAVNGRQAGLMLLDTGELQAGHPCEAGVPLLSTPRTCILSIWAGRLGSRCSTQVSSAQAASQATCPALCLASLRLACCTSGRAQAACRSRAAGAACMVNLYIQSSKRRQH